MPYPTTDTAFYDEGYRAGFTDGYQSALKRGDSAKHPALHFQEVRPRSKPKTKRKPSKYNLFVKAKSKGQKFKYQSGKDKGKLNMTTIGIAWRKTRR